MRRNFWRSIVLILATADLAACRDDITPTAPPTAPASPASRSAGESETSRHIVMFTGRDAPADFATRVTARGGAVDEILPGAGLAIVDGLTAAAAAELATTGGIEAVGADATIGPDPFEELLDGLATDALSARSAAIITKHDADDGASGLHPDKATHYASQWNMRVIKAASAWKAGFLGSSDVNVYLLDTGVDYTRPDLQGLVDDAHSKSLVPRKSTDEDRLVKDAHVREYMDFHSHGTAVASTIVSNGIDLAGVSSKTTIVAVKVLDRSRSGEISTFVRGIIYAANHRADIIHLSLAFPGFGRDTSAARIAMVDRATTYAHERGSVIMVAAGNAGANLEGDTWRFCNARYALCVAATGPTAFTNGEWLNPDVVPKYSNYGPNTITVAGPGGTDARNLRVLVNCSRSSRITTGNPAPCGSGADRFETTGTTFGAAAASGLAALIISRVGHGQPDVVRDVLIESADDLGIRAPSNYAGMRRINVESAMACLTAETCPRRAK